MTKFDIVSKILMEMDGTIGDCELKVLRNCLYKNLYGLTILEESTEVTTTNDLSNEELLRKFIFEKKIEGLSNTSLLQYKRETERFFSIIDKHYCDVKPDDINYYLAILMSKNLSVNSIDNARKFIKPFFKWLYENEYISKDIFVNIKPIKRIDKQKEYLTNEEITKIRDESQYDTRSLALIDFLLSTGVRVSECSNLKITDVDFVKGEANIFSTKTGEWRKVYLDANALKHLQDYLNTRKDLSPYLFVNLRQSSNGKISKMSKTSIEKIIHKYCRQANILKHCTVHIFRKDIGD